MDFSVIQMLSKQDAFFLKKHRFPFDLYFGGSFILTCHKDLDLMTDSVCVGYLLFRYLVVYLGVLVNLKK